MERGFETKAFLKKDLFKVIILTLVLLGFLVGIKILDIKTGYVAGLSQKIANIFIH